MSGTISEVHMRPEEPLDRKERDFSEYTGRMENPSKDFDKFLYDYFTGHPMIRHRGEEDVTVWNRLEDEELEIAKQMIFDNLGRDSAYIKAIGVFRDECGIPLLEHLVETIEGRYCYEKLLAAKILYDWIGYEEYPELLMKILPRSGSYTKTSLDYWIDGIDKDLATECIFMMLRDEESFVRWCAYGTLKEYFDLERDRYNSRHQSVEEQEKYYKENKYYTDDAIYSKKRLFKARMMELESKISNR